MSNEYTRQIERKYGIKLDRIKPVYEMTPSQWCRQKSFNKKAIIINDEAIFKVVLMSYQTKVAEIIRAPGCEVRLRLLNKGKWSNTTVRHIKNFIQLHIGTICRNMEYAMRDPLSISTKDLKNWTE